MNEHVQMGVNKLFSLAQSFSKSTAWNESFGDTESVQAQQSLNKAMNMAKQFARDHHVSEDKAFHIPLNAGAGTSGSSSSIIGKLGNLFSANATGQFDAAGKNNQSISKNIRSESAQQFADHLSQGLQYLEDHKGSLNDAFQRQEMDQVQHHFNQARQYSDQVTASLQQSQMWSQTAAQQRQKGLSSGSNINDEILGYVADKKFGGDRRAAAAWQSQHSSQYQKEVEGFLDQRQKLLQDPHVLTQKEIQRTHHKKTRSVQETPVTNHEMEDKRRRYNLPQKEHQLDQKLTEHRSKTHQDRQTHQAGIRSEDIQKNIETNEKKFQKEDSRYLVKKAWKKLRNG